MPPLLIAVTLPRRSQRHDWSNLTARDQIQAGLDLLVDLDWLAEIHFSMQQDAFVRAFNNFAQANGKPLRLALKVTDTSRIGKFVYDRATVTGLSKETNQVIDTLLVTATASVFNRPRVMRRYFPQLAADHQTRPAVDELTMSLTDELAIVDVWAASAELRIPEVQGEDMHMIAPRRVG